MRVVVDRLEVRAPMLLVGIVLIVGGLFAIPRRPLAAFAAILVGMLMVLW